MVYGSTFFMNTYDLIQDMAFSQARDWTAGAKLTYHVKDWFSVTGSLHADFTTASSGTSASTRATRTTRVASGSRA